MAMNRNQFPSLLERGLNTVFGLEYKEYPEEWRGCFEVFNSDQAKEEDVLVTDFGAASVKAEGADASLDEALEAYTALYMNRTVALGFEFTEEAEEDNLYLKLGPKYSRALAKSMQHSKELFGAAIFNNAFDTNYPGGDGKPLLATDHPLVGGGTGSNKLATGQDLSEDSVKQLLIQIRKITDDRGKPVMLRPTKLIIPPDLEYVAEVVLKSAHRPGTHDNDINPLASKSIFGSDPHIVTRLTDANAWFIKTDVSDGLKYSNRKNLMTRTYVAERSGNKGFVARERYAFGWTDWRGLFGSTV